MGSPVVLLCRICGSTTDGDTFVDIFSAEGEKNHLEQKLNFCFTKEVSTKILFLYRQLINKCNVMFLSGLEYFERRCFINKIMYNLLQCSGQYLFKCQKNATISNGFISKIYGNYVHLLLKAF